jgi:Na+-transporting methylmalonyl-CoA/oxaloacetate decarboxylase gamma subunit
METKAEKVAHSDEYGIGITLISMTVVFGSLFLIFIVMKTFTKILNRKSTHSKLHNTLSKSQNEKNAKAEKVAAEKKILDNGEEIAAISMALHLHFNDAHDYESEIITIETPNTQFSPWSQKNLTMKRSLKKS